MGKKIVGIVFILAVVLLTTLVLATSQKHTRDCKRNCTIIKRNETKICSTSYKECRNICRENKKSCLNETKHSFLQCKEGCNDRQCVRNCSKQMRIDKKECSKRECLFDCRNESKNCKADVKANFSSCKEGCEISSFKMGEEACTGLYYEVCNGPYFDIVCSKEKFCICGGNAEYECPEGYDCNKKIRNLLPRKNTIKGYKDLLGNDLGDIGVCEKI